MHCDTQPLTDKVSAMVRQTVFGFKLERTEEPLTAHGGLALVAEFNHGLGLCGLVDRLILMLQAGAGVWRTYGS